VSNTVDFKHIRWSFPATPAFARTTQWGNNQVDVSLSMMRAMAVERINDLRSLRLGVSVSTIIG